ncbi:hypothetical protein BDB00DRAFT_908870 [Zychaea mexicana]|uniref:uncharacterized protein n=1 Tax=Zychaea mexicana TaxID=64656 RepID=UPI0022FE0B69|nr:uncharacterized protein BDB00DRAFT_908870 [Zychaea mexicana]KAI9493001.1 hypothetical protein BDB00DRAFT_908870 [Zychaea mexicana]
MNNNNNSNIQNTDSFTIAAPWAQEVMSGNNMNGWGSPPAHIPSRQEGGWREEPMDVDDESASSQQPTTPPPPKDATENAFEKIASLVHEDLRTHIELTNYFAEASTLLAMREHVNEQLLQLAGHANRIVARCRVHPQPYFSEDQVRSIVINTILQNTFT